MEKLKTMADVLESQVKLIEGLEIVSCRELRSHYKVVLKYKEYISKESRLESMCAIGKEIDNVRFFLETVITGLLLEHNKMVEASKWLKHEVWNDIDKQHNDDNYNTKEKLNIILEEIKDVSLQNIIKEIIFQNSEVNWDKVEEIIIKNRPGK